MPKLGERKCPSCGDYSNPDGEYPWEYGDITERMICYGCYESDCEHASAIVRFTNEGREAMRVGDDVAFDPEHGDVDDWFFDVFDKRTYVRTDGWRGYYVTSLKGTYEALASGWVTGMPDDTVGYKRVAIDLAEYLDEEHRGYETLPDGAVLYWIFDPTSNLFSTASELLVPVECADAVQAWLVACGFELGDIETSFH